MAAKKEENIKRIPITLNLANKEDREVYEILSKKSNRTYYIRQAILHFHHGARLDLQTADDIKSVVAAAIRENMVFAAEGSQEELAETKRITPQVVSQEDKKPKVEKTDENPVTEITEQENLDLSGIEDLF